MEDFDEWLRRVVGVPAALPEIIFSKDFKQRIHIEQSAYEMFDGQNLYRPVYGAIDPGYSGESRYVVEAIQIVGNQIRVIDEICERGATHSQVKMKAMAREWWPVMKTGTIDPRAGGSHVYGSTSPQEEWKDDKVAGSVDLALPKRLGEEDLIRLIQTYLQGARGFTLHISPKCERLIHELRTWKRKRTKQGLGTPANAPCDAIKALGYFLTHHQEGQIGPLNKGVMVREYSLVRGRGTDPVLQSLENLQSEQLYGIAGDEFREDKIW